MKTYTREDIHNEIVRSVELVSSHQMYNQLVTALRKREQTFVADSLIEFLMSESGKLYDHQEMAARLLLELKPSTSIPLERILAQTLPNWNKSVEQLPQYLVNMFGEAKLKVILTQMRSGANEHLIDLLDTFEWWLKVTRCSH